jgi:hypothetical protein
MKTQIHTYSVAQGTNPNPAGRRINTRSLKSLGLALFILVSLGVFQISQMTQLAGAADPDDDAITLYELTLNGNGDLAVQQLAEIALARGGWGPAPEDSVVYDPDLALSVRASVHIVDLPPGECTDPMMKHHTGSECNIDFTRQQDLVRFGYSAFVEVAEDGSLAPRLSVDDLLSVYIEEVGHSWQEYLYETGGRGSGERKSTSWEASKYWGSGWEYQAKMYILSLDGTWLTLSDAERAEVKTAICAEGGYANPTKSALSTYGPPPGWPNPQGWPTVAPTVEEFQTFCYEPGA